MKQEKCKKKGLDISKRKVTRTSRKMEEEQKSHLTRCLRPGQRCLKTRSNGPEDAVVSEMIKQLPLEKIYIYYEVLSGALHEPAGSTQFLEDCETGDSEETGC